jgi:DNA mismatch repair protein MutS2
LETVDALGQLDLAFAKGKLAVQMEATRPALISFNRLPAGTPVVSLQYARHPLLRGDVVPMSVELGRDYDILLITGPNTGGKTVALKTAGLLVLMAQAGLQVPADEGSSLAIFSGVYADIGDEQSIEQSLSTFSSHISRIIEVLSLADQHSLVLLDEVGAGTDPQEGSALSRAILEHLAASRIYTIATTHSSELKTFAYTTPRVENASVEFDTNTLSPTYHLTVGLPGRSNALAIAQRLGMPKNIVDSARAMLSPTQVQADELLAEIHEQLARARDERSAAARARSEADRSLHQLRSRQAALEREKEEILARTEEEGVELARELRREADALRRELRGMRDERARLTEIEDRISQLRRPAAASHPTSDREVDRPHLAVGQHVRVGSLGVEGVVRTVASNGVTAEVEVDGKRFKLSPSDLTPTEAAAIASPRVSAVNAGYLAAVDSPRRIGSEGWSPVESQLDLRGLTTEEARYRLDQFLNDAYMEGLQNVRIVHGKGTGAVRQAVRDILVDHPLVKSHQTAAQNEGGEGATEVRLAS